MAIVRVQSKAAASNSTTAPTLTFDAVPTAGNVIVMAYGAATGLWIPAAGNIEWLLYPFTQSSSRHAGLAIGIVKGSPSATVTCAQPTGAAALVAAEYSGLGGIKLDRQKSAASSSGTALASGATPTTDTAVELWVGCLFSAAARPDTTTFFTALTNSFSAVAEVNSTLNTTSDRSVCLTERIVSSTGTPNTGATAAISGQWVALVAALAEIPAGGGGGMLVGNLRGFTQ